MVHYYSAASVSFLLNWFENHDVGARGGVGSCFQSDEEETSTPFWLGGMSSDRSLRAQQCGIVDVGMVHVSGGVVRSRAAAANAKCS